MSYDKEILKLLKQLWSIQCKKGELYCYLCGNKIHNIHECNAEHWIPKSKGGTTDTYNIKSAHKLCNSLKGNMTPEEWDENKAEILLKHGIKLNEDYDISRAKIDLSAKNLQNAISSDNVIIPYDISDSKIKEKISNKKKLKNKKKKRIQYEMGSSTYYLKPLLKQSEKNFKNFKKMLDFNINYIIINTIKR